MLRSIKLFLRGFKRDKAFSIINISGLSLGIACSLLIYLFVQSELSHDKFHEKGDHIYRINQTFIWGDDTRQLFSSTGPGVSYALKSDIPEIQEVTRIHTTGGYLITYDNGNEIISHEESNIFAADSNFLEVFTFELILGDKNTALSQPNSLILTEESAQKYFGEENPIGKQLQLGKAGNMRSYQITGVAKNIPDNSYIDFDFLLSMSSFPGVMNNNWSWIWTTFETYILLDPLADPEEVRSKVAALPPIHAEGTLQRVMGITFADYIKSGKEWNLYMQPYENIHLGSANIFNRLNSVGNQMVVNVLSAAAIFILILSCINYINLKTSQITRNAKDTGIRKLLGSNTINISFRYITESVIFVASSILVGFLITYFVLPSFNQIVAKNIEIQSLFSLNILSVLLVLGVLMSLICGLYPSLILSAFSPLDVIRGKLKSGEETKWLRNGMIVFQFSISIILIASTLVVYEQLQYSLNKDLGFEKDNLMSVHRVEWLQSPESFSNELEQITGVVSTSLSRSLPPGLFDGDQFLPEDDQNRSVALNFTQADHKFLSTMEIDLLYGRDFTELGDQEEDKIILNESAVSSLGWKLDESVIGKKVIYPGKEDPYIVIGVIKDFNYWSTQVAIEPMALFHINKSFYGDSYNNLFVAVRIESENYLETIEKIENAWNDQDAGMDFRYTFVEDSFANRYKSTKRFGKILTVFAFIAIFIAGLGLLGMVIYVIEQRTKEIGIRKVLGSTNIQVVSLMSKRFVILITIALLMSIPVSWYGMDLWLSGFEYRTTVSPMIYLFAGSLSIILAISIVGFHSLRAAMMNPAEVLKDE